MKQWANYLFHRDFSAHSEYLATIGIGEADAGVVQGLVAALNDVDTGEGAGLWSDSPFDDTWSVHGVTIEYNGDNKQSMPTKSKFSKVLVLSFPAGMVKPQGKLYVQYN